MLNDFFYQHFIKPITEQGIQGYNLVNTITYLLILIGACYFIFITLKNKINFDYKFFIALIPYILFGVSLRIIMHMSEIGNPLLDITKTANPLEVGFWFFTPGIWIFTFILVLIGLIIGRIDKKLIRKRLFLTGCVFAGWPISIIILSMNNLFWVIGTTILIIITTYGICFLVNKYTKYKILSDPINLMVVLGQGIDGIASAIAISFFSFTEQHVFSKIIMDIHPALFIIIKLSLGILIVYSLDDYLNENPKNHKRKKLIKFIKLIIAIIGFATGLGSLLKIGII
jgi:uncharacterized membrane protein